MTHTKRPTAHAARTRAVSVRIALALLLTLLHFAPTRSQEQRRGVGAQTKSPASREHQQQQERPRLVLLIAVDQFRYDYFERFGDLFAQNGLRRLLREGASWSAADYDHIPTETAPGHATMLTGTWPSESGIIGNAWFDRETGKVLSNVYDGASKLIGGGADEPASSPRTLLVSTLGDELKLATQGRAKVIGISVKDRAAILPAGRRADAAYWFSSQTGNFVTSSYYFAEPPAWVARFNAARRADKYFGAKWERLLCEGASPRATCEAEYVRRAGADDAEWENLDAKDKDTRTFPHVVTGGASKPGREFYDAINYSPFSNDLVADFAREAIVNESLGADADTDVLTVSFSANDIVGHRFGPYSQETMDMTLRVDRQIGSLLDFVDEKVGLKNVIVVFTSDHGVAPVPEHASRVNLPGGRIKPSEIIAAIKKAIRVRYQKGAEDNTADYVAAFSNYNLYFNYSALERDGVKREEIERAAGEAALKVPGISRYFTRTQLQSEAVSPADPVARRALHGFNARRSGDVVIVQEPFKYIIEGNLTATHGTPYSYDTRVPVVIFGAGVAPGSYSQAATPADIAPTLANLLRVQPPSNATGRILFEAIR